MIRSYRTATVFCTAATLLAAAACDSNSPSKSTGSAEDDLTYVTAFGAAGRDAFAWVAEQKGYFREAGIDVRIELGKATGENLKVLASGKAQFTSLDLTGAMISAGAKNSTAYRDFRAVLAIHQQSGEIVAGPDLVSRGVVGEEAGPDVLEAARGTQSGRRFRLGGKGMPVLRAKQCGDMYVQVVVETPQSLTKRQRELLAEFEKLSSKDTQPEATGFFSRVKDFFGNSARSG